MKTSAERGQVLLIIILVIVVVLTVGLSIISRSIINLRTSREGATTQKALSAAEAGIEQVFKTGIGIPLGTFSGTDATYIATSNPVLGISLLVSGGNAVPKDDGADIWLVAHDPVTNKPIFTPPWSGNLTIYWGDASGACNNAAMEIIVVYDPLSPKFKRYSYDPCSSRVGNNNFSSALSGVNIISTGGKTLAFSYLTPISIPISSGLVIRVVPLYASSSIGVNVTSGPALPSQGTIIDSTGVSQGTSRKIKVFKGYPQLPIQYFSYGLFSP